MNWVAYLTKVHESRAAAIAELDVPAPRRNFRVRRVNYRFKICIAFLGSDCANMGIRQKGRAVARTVMSTHAARATPGPSIAAPATLHDYPPF